MKHIRKFNENISEIKIGDIVTLKKDESFDIDAGKYKVIAIDKDENEIFLRKAKLDMSDSGLRLDLDYFYGRGYWKNGIQ